MSDLDTELLAKRPVVLFDGVCNLCHGAVRFLTARDPQGHFRFASLESQSGRELVRRYRVDSDEVDSIVLIDGDGAHTRSEAALRIARQLGGAWPALTLLRLVPRPLRDAFYDGVARNRYRWFGRRDSCPVPTPELRARFLD